MLDTRRVCVHQAGGDEAAGTASFVALQGPWLPRREAFEGLWRHGDRLVCGSLNAGGMGAETFGPFCLVVDHPSQPVPDALGLFPSDSLVRYTTADGSVDRHAAVAEVTGWDEHSDLGVVERGGDALGQAEERWPSIVCSSDTYLEVVRAAALPVPALGAVRFREDYRRRLDELQARELVGEEITGPSRNEVAAYSAVNRWRSAHGTLIEDAGDPVVG